MEELDRAIINACWQLIAGRPLPPPPKGVSVPRWTAMVNQRLREVEANQV